MCLSPSSLTYAALIFAQCLISSCVLAEMPVATDDYFSAASGSALMRAVPGLLANDISSGGSLTAIKVSDPAHGAAVLNADGSFNYTSEDGYQGFDSFTYKVNDGTADSNVATVFLRVGGGAVRRFRSQSTW